MYANESQHVPTVKPTSSKARGTRNMYNSNSFQTNSFNYQHGFGPSSGSSMASTSEYDSYSGSSMAGTSLFSAVPMPQRSTSYSPTSPPMVPDDLQVPYLAIEKPQTQYQQYRASEDDWHYKSAPFSNQTQHSNHGVENSAFFLEESTYNREQKQRSLSEGTEEDRSWNSVMQRPNYAQKQQNYVNRQQRNSFLNSMQVSHGEEKTSSDFAVWRKENTIDRHHASTSVSFLKQHDEKPVQALIAWERYSAARKP